MMQVMTYAIGVYLGDYQGMDEGIRQFLNLVSIPYLAAMIQEYTIKQVVTILVV